MIAGLMSTHTLAGIDRTGVVCSCGERDVDFLEHLGTVALSAYELERMDVRVPDTVAETRASPQSDRIDRLIWAGRTDREISKQLFIPARIVRARRIAGDTETTAALAA